MKKDKRYFMDKLPCGISRMKHNNTIEQLRGSKTRENIKVDEKEEERVPYDEMIPGGPKRRRSARKPPAPPSTGAVREQQFNHGEEITHENHRRSDSFSKSASTSQFMMTTASSSTSTTGYHEHDTSSSTSKTAKHAYMNFQGKENTANTQQATAGKHSLAANTKFEQKEREAESLNEQQRRQKNIDNWMGESPTDELGDFGLARTQHEDSEPSLETRVVGTLGYLAPQYAECGKVSTKTDVYAFGVVLLQLITGLKTTDKILGGIVSARPLLKERNYPDLIDQRILESHDVHQLFWMVRVAEKCLSKDRQKRLTMDKVVYALNYIIESNSTCSLGELTSAKPDSPSSVQDSYESYDDTPSYTIETFSPSFPTDITSTGSTSLRLPPSPPINFRHHLHY
uniref:Inactive protein kinase n=1 Tax=Populus alba TaxID=43335 RepID=A0A4U5QFK1_POPAL|nr:inactive protein kinase [Populus alba]